MLKACMLNKIGFRYVLADTWYGSTENMNYIAKDLKHFFLIPLKANRKVALSSVDKDKGLYQAVSDLDLDQGSVSTIYLEGIDFPLNLTKLIFKNEDDSEATLYLVSNDLTLDVDQMAVLHQDGVSKSFMLLSKATPHWQPHRLKLSVRKKIMSSLLSTLSLS